MITAREFFRGGSEDDPKEIINWKIYALTIVACMGGFVYGYDSGVMGGLLVIASFRRSFSTEGLSATELADKNSNIVAMLQTGAFFGALSIVYFADRFGRKKSLIGAGVVFLVGSVIQVAAAPHIWLLMLGRAIGGFGVGAWSTLTPLYVSENVPRSIRGRLAGSYQFFIQVGLLISFWINYGQQLHYPSVAAQWQIPLAIQMLPGVILMVGMLFLKESPRHLARIGRWEDASRALCWIRNLPDNHDYIEGELLDMRLQLENEGTLVDGIQHGKLLREMFTIRSNLKRLLFGCAIQALQQLMGVNAINYYSPTIFKQLGLSGTSTSLFATGIYGVVKVISSFMFSLFIADVLGRKRACIYPAIIQAACLFYVGGFVAVANPKAGQSVSGAGIFALVCIYLYIAAFEMGWGPVVWVYNGEIHTARLRTYALGITSAVSWGFNFMVSKTTPLMLVSMGTGGCGAFFFYGAFCVVCVLFGIFLAPETRGKSLEAMDEFFGTPKVVDDEHIISVHHAHRAEGDFVKEKVEHM